MQAKIDLPKGKKIYFLSDFHLGVPSHKASIERERKIIAFLNQIEKDAAALLIVGDIFDFWFEYKHTVPKGYVRLLGKIASMSDGGLPITLFTGNHDMWMFDYLPKELGVKIFREPTTFQMSDKLFLVGHGDGLGPGDTSYKLIKWVFANNFFQWIFSLAPPKLSFFIATYWSKHSRLNNKNNDEQFLGTNEWIYQFCEQTHVKKQHDYYIFGHRHLPIDMKVSDNSRYINLGEWVNYFTYAVFDGDNVELKKI